MTSTVATELMERRQDGVAVRLLYRALPLTLAVQVEAAGETYTFAVADPADATEAFWHPFAYADPEVLPDVFSTRQAGGDAAAESGDVPPGGQLRELPPFDADAYEQARRAEWEIGDEDGEEVAA